MREHFREITVQCCKDMAAVDPLYQYLIVQFAINVGPYLAHNKIYIGCTYIVYD